MFTAEKKGDRRRARRGGAKLVEATYEAPFRRIRRWSR